jgi:maltose 6'-phosphate phosphatase
MKVLCNLLRSAALLFAFLFLLPHADSGWCLNGNAQSSNAAGSKHLKVLSINLLFSEIQTRDDRLSAIADRVAKKKIDVVLLQEVVGGLLVGTDNSAEDLRDILLEEHGLNYNLRTAFEIGVPGLLGVANATLSRFEIEFTLVKTLPGASELEFNGFSIELERNVQMVRLKIPNFGKIDVFNTHLCARCELVERDEQLDVLRQFIKDFESDSPGKNPNVLGGDFNFDRFDNDGTERFMYEKIISDGFIDAYALAVDEPLDTLCEDEDNADEHCTVGVSDLNGDNARRIDYIFSKGFKEVIESSVFFNTAITGETTVSDHAAVFTSLDLPFIAAQPHILLLLLGY